MTREEAIRLLGNLFSMCLFKDAYGEFVDSEPYYEAIDMAIYDMGIVEQIKKERDAALEELKEVRTQMSSADAQPDRGCIDQIMWERDTAIQQLAELGYGFGEKIRTDGDCISRQAAIDAFDMLLIDNTGRQNAERVVEYLQTVIQRIKELPTAQPEPQ